MRLYQGGCSFLLNPDIFIDTCLSEYFGKNLININNCVGGSSNTQIFRKAFFSIMKSNFDFVIIGWSQCWRDDKSMPYHIIDKNTEIDLLSESYSDVLKTHINYEMIYPNNELKNYCKFEPQATDDVISYTIILQNLLKSKNIPHLFLTMGENNLKTLNSRLGWLEMIDSKNYYGRGNIIEKMNHSITKYFQKKHIEEGYGNHYNYSMDSIGYIRDEGSHLNNNAKHILAKNIMEYLLENKIV